MRRLTILVLSAALAACSGPKSTPIPTDPSKWDTLASSSKRLSDDDRRLLATYLMRMGVGAAFGNSKVSVPPGTTIGDAIDAQSKFEADQKEAEVQAAAVKSKADAQLAQRAARLKQAATVVLTNLSVLSKNYDAGRYSDRLALTFAIMNRTGKAISGVKGVTVFDDQFGAEISRMSLSMDEDVAPNSTRTIEGYGKDINQFEADDQKLATTPFSKIKATFIPEMIVFADGSKLGSTEAE